MEEVEQVSKYRNKFLNLIMLKKMEKDTYCARKKRLNWKM